MIVGIKSFYEDGTPTVQLWNGSSGKPIGEYEYDSPKIPQNYILCDTIGEFNHFMYLARR